MGNEGFEVESTSGEGDERAVRMRVPVDSRFFEGHFEGRPMLPGVAQVVAIAQREAARVFGALGTPIRMSRVKFQDVILPGDALTLTLMRATSEAPSETLVRFRIERVLSEGPRVASSGTITYASKE